MHFIVEIQGRQFLSHHLQRAQSKLTTEQSRWLGQGYVVVASPEPKQEA